LIIFLHFGASFLGFCLNFLTKDCEVFWNGSISIKRPFVNAVEFSNRENMPQIFLDDDSLWMLEMAQESLGARNDLTSHEVVEDFDYSLFSCT
jgi:hypothetical protein